MRSLDIQIRQKKPAARKRIASPWPGAKISAKRKSLAGIAALAILVAGLLAFLVLPEARITVVARTEPVTRDFEIAVSQNETSPNPAELTIPAKIVTEEVEDKKTVPATGVRNVGRKASGFVYIYNFSKTTLILRAGTTVLAAGSRQYVFAQDVTGIRPTAFIGLENQEIDETSLIPPVPVIAAAPGESYNLAKGSRLEIDNQVFGRKPQSLYAAVAEDLSGGSTKEVKYVTEADIENAGNALAAEITDRELQKLSATPESAAVSVLEKKASVPAATETPEFEISAKVKIEALVYKESDVREIVTERIERLLPKNKLLRHDDGRRRLQHKFTSISLSEGRGTLSTHFEGEVVYTLDKAELIEKAKGKNADEIREILLSRPEIDKVEIKFYPAWVKKAPSFGKKIFLNIVDESG